MKKLFFPLLIIALLTTSLVGCSNTSAPSTLINSNSQTNSTYEPHNSTLTEDEWNFITADNSGLAEKRKDLYELAASAIGEEKSVENVAIDGSTVKFLLTEIQPDNALLIQYAILYRMHSNYNLTVQFIFYKEKGDSQTAYLRSTFSAETLATLDWNKVSILNLKDYASTYNEIP